MCVQCHIGAHTLAHDYNYNVISNLRWGSAQYVQQNYHLLRSHKKHSYLLRRVFALNLLDYYSKANEYAEFSLYENLNVLRSAFAKHFGKLEQPRISDLVRFVEDYKAITVILTLWYITISPGHPLRRSKGKRQRRLLREYLMQERYIRTAVLQIFMIRSPCQQNYRKLISRTILLL